MKMNAMSDVFCPIERKRTTDIMPARLNALAMLVPMTAIISAMTEQIEISVTANSIVKPFFLFIYA